MTLASALSLSCLATDRRADAAVPDPHSVLGLITFGADLPAPPGVPVARIGAPPLTASGQAAELWCASPPFRSGRHGEVGYRTGDGLVFAQVRVAEAGGGLAALQAAVTQAYGGLFACLQSLGSPRPLRIWNFLADINGVVEGVERYRAFNEARQRAFQAAARQVRVDVPAASAVGLPRGEPLCVYALAADHGGLPVENPRQIAAYDYPPEHGAWSPTFARAMVAPAHCGGLLFVSGTASIVGHRTVHAGDAAAQTRESLANLHAVIEAANARVGARRYATADAQYKVYVRDPADQPRIAATLAALAHPRRPVLWLQADICRADLLVEIEAIVPPVEDEA